LALRQAEATRRSTRSAGSPGSRSEEEDGPTSQILIESDHSTVKHALFLVTYPWAAENTMRIDAALRAEFVSKGYTIIDDFLSVAEVHQILESIQDYQASGREVIQVDQHSIIRTQVFKTIVGSHCEDHIALFSDLWRRRILDISKEVSGLDLLPLND